MKVLFISNDPLVFDASSSVRARMRAYAKVFGELHILSPGKRTAKEERDGSLVLYPLHGMRLFVLFAMMQRAREIIRRETITVVSAQDPFEYGFVALQAVLGTRAKLSIQIHTDFLSPWFTRSGNFRSLQIRMPLLNGVRRRIADLVLPHADGIRVVSLRIKDSLIARYGTRINVPCVIPVGIPSSIPEAVSLPDHEFSFIFITVSRLESEKRIQDILMALARLGPRYHQVGLMIVGDGRERSKLGRLSRKLGLGRRVFFLGSRKNAWGLMRSAHAYVQASAYEGYGLTLLEAALAKIPIITTDVGIVGEVFQGYTEVLATPVADTANFSVHMEKLIQDHQLRATLVANAEIAAQKHMNEYKDKPELFAAHLTEITSHIA